MNTDTTRRIRELNDELRQKHEGGEFALSAGVAALQAAVIAEIAAAVCAFDRFDAENDPHCEHDFGSLCVRGESIIWKIDYYDRSSLCIHSPDAADRMVTRRMLTIMLESDY